MRNVNDQILSLFSYDLFRQVLEQKPISVLKYNALSNFLMYKHIPFDVSYSPGDAKRAESLQITVNINPAASLVLQINLEPGSSVNTPSQ